MATNHTTNYALNLWEPQDAFLREEFNENTQKLDAALDALPQMVVGSYTGTGKYGENNPNGLEFPDAKRPPRVILVTDDQVMFPAVFFRGMTEIVPVRANTFIYKTILNWTEKGVSYYCKDCSTGQFNDGSKVYYYMVIF